MRLFEFSRLYFHTIFLAPSFQKLQIFVSLHPTAPQETIIYQKKAFDNSGRMVLSKHEKVNPFCHKWSRRKTAGHFRVMIDTNLVINSLLPYLHVDFRCGWTETAFALCSQSKKGLCLLTRGPLSSGIALRPVQAAPFHRRTCWKGRRRRYLFYWRTFFHNYQAGTDWMLWTEQISKVLKV